MDNTRSMGSSISDLGKRLRLLKSNEYEYGSFRNLTHLSDSDGDTLTQIFFVI